MPLKLTTWEPFEIEYEGEVIKMEVRPLRLPEMLLLEPLMPKSKELADKMTPAEQMELMKVSAEVFKTAVRNVDIELEDGEEFTPDQIATDSRLYDVVAWRVLNHLFELSSLKKEEAKNSDGPSEHPEETKQESSSPAGPADGG